MKVVIDSDFMPFGNPARESSTAQVGISYRFTKAKRLFQLGNRSPYRSLTFNLDAVDYVFVAGWIRCQPDSLSDFG
jgi:hypothetical protein